MTKIILASSPSPATEGTVEFRIVIRETHRPGELVVHHQDIVGAGFYWGHYFPDAKTDVGVGIRAVNDYLETCAKYNLNPLGGVDIPKAKKPRSGQPDAKADQSG